MDEDEVRRIFQHDCCMVGSDGLPNDAHPHPRLWGSFTRVLGRYVREAELLTLEAAVAKMSALPARVFGLAGRGRIAVGAWADIVVFDADTVADLATWEAPTLPSAGVERVLVNGVQVHPPMPDTPRPGRFCAARSRRKHNDSIHRRLPMFRKTCARWRWPPHCRPPMPPFPNVPSR